MHNNAATMHKNILYGHLCKLHNEANPVKSLNKAQTTVYRRKTENAI